MFGEFSDLAKAIVTRQLVVFGSHDSADERLNLFFFPCCHFFCPYTNNALMSSAW